MPVLVGLQRPVPILLNRLERAGTVSKGAAVGRALPVNRNIQQTREIDIRRGEHDTHLAFAHRLDGGNLRQSVVKRRSLVKLRRLQACDYVARGQFFARPEGYVVPQGEGEGCAVARIRFTQHIFRRKVRGDLKQSLIQCLAQHAVDAGVVQHRIECAVLIPRQTEIRIRHLDIVNRRILAAQIGQTAGAQQAQRCKERGEHAFFPFHKPDFLSVTGRSRRPARRAGRASCGATRIHPSGTWYRYRCQLRFPDQGLRPAAAERRFPANPHGTLGLSP